MPVVSVVARAAALAACVALAAPAQAQPPTPVPASPVRPAATSGSGAVKRLTVDEAVALALEQNLSLRVQRISPELQQANVDQASTAWTPSLTGFISYNNTDTPPDSFLSGSSDTLKTDLFQGQAGVQQLTPWGATWFAGWNARRSTSNSIYNTFNPTLRSNLSLQYVQPLLRDRTVDSSRQQLIVSKRNRDISDIDLRGSVVSTVRNVKNAYWNLKAAIANLDVQKQSLELARQTLKDNRTRVEVGTMAPIDIVEAESEVARNEENVIVAESNIRLAEDQLRALVFDPAAPDFWSVVIDPIDPPQTQQQAIDVDAAIRNALERRTDLRSAKASLDNVESNLKFYKNQTLPQVNLEVDYGTTGVGGTQFVREPGFPPGPIIAEVSRGFWTVQQDVWASNYPTWTLGVNVTYPLGKTAAHASYTRSQLELNQGRLQIMNLELQIGTQVRDVGRQVNTNSQRVRATGAARALAERRLEAEQKKFNVGTSTSFLVFQAQRDLATARVNELQALLDYNKSLVDFEAVQEAALGGGGITISGGGSFLATTAGTQTATAATQGTAQR
jgi:outer membrane protein TolC